MLFLYICATILTIFVGFRDAAGRNTKINKTSYYQKCILRAFLFGQAFFASLFTIAYFCAIDFSVIEALSQNCFHPFSLYIALVLLTFIPYLVPNWEIKSLVTVLVFGPLTTLQPLVIIATLIYVIPLYLEHHIECIFVLTGSSICLFFELFLDKMGWSKKEAELSFSSSKNT